MKISQRVLELLSGLDFHNEIIKGHNSVKDVHGVKVLILCTSSDDVLYLFQNSCINL